MVSRKKVTNEKYANFSKPNTPHAAGQTIIGDQTFPEMLFYENFFGR